MLWSEGNSAGGDPPEVPHEVHPGDAFDGFPVQAAAAQGFDQVGHLAGVPKVRGGYLDAVEVGAEAHNARAAQLADMVDMLGHAVGVGAAVPAPSSLRKAG